MKLDEICYKHTPIKSVIVRIDFLESVPKLNDSLPTEILDVIRNSFPTTERRDLLARELQISDGKMTTNISNKKVWNFHTSEKSASLFITEDSFVIKVKDYISFEKIHEVLKEIKEIFFNYYANLRSKRLGLRYVNEINLKGNNPIDWKGYLNQDLIAIFKVSKHPEKIIRAFHNLEVRYDDIILKFQYGMHNQDYPAIIKKKTFILDLDAFHSGVLTQNEIDQYLTKQHSIIQTQFENSITEKLKRKFGLELPTRDVEN